MDFFHEQKHNVSLGMISPITPDIQRTLDQDHLQELYEQQMSYITTHGKLIVNGSISIATHDGTEYLMDGQHRLTVLRKIQKENPEIQCLLTVDYFFCSKKEQVDQVFKFVNGHKVNQYIGKMEISDFKKINDIQKYFSTTFSDFLRKTAKPHKPYMNLETISKKIHSAVIMYPDINWVDEIKQLNTFYSNLDEKIFLKWKINITKLKIELDSKPNRLYLGLWDKFEWIYFIIFKHEEKVEYKDFDHFAYFRKKYNAKDRDSVWGKTNDLRTNDGECYCCKKLISRDNFEVGHNNPKIRGGRDTLDNLFAICKKCNLEMGITTIDAFKKSFLSVQE